jgi:hypothetical protein
VTTGYRLSNATSRPVQLHLADGVTVVPAYGVLACTAATLEEAQVRVLCRNGVLYALPGEPAPDPDPAPDPAAGADPAPGHEPAGASEPEPLRARSKRKPANRGHVNP